MLKQLKKNFDKLIGIKAKGENSMARNGVLGAKLKKKFP